jgi:O-methyltransferase involved in polyketide biosynthesis
MKTVDKIVKDSIHLIDPKIIEELGLATSDVFLISEGLKEYLPTNLHDALLGVVNALVDNSFSGFVESRVKASPSRLKVKRRFIKNF